MKTHYNEQIGGHTLWRHHLQDGVWVLGDDIDTDIIIPTEYLALKTIDDMKQYGFSPLRPELAGQIQPGDIIVAGKNFGCGSSREQAPEIIKALGIQCVIAKSFARIFFRNSINNGLLLIEQPELHDACEGGGRPVTVVMNQHVDLSMENSTRSLLFRRI